MKRILLKSFAILSLLVLTNCGSYFNQPYDFQDARLGETSDVTQRLTSLSLPKEPVVVGVYKFRDQTGQYKPSETGGSFSTAVTQGATTILIKALEDSKWFVPIERENLSNLLNERRIIESTRQVYRKTSNPDEPQLPPLMFAGILLEGGIISYDTNIITGGLGARYFGIGSSTQYRQDRITVYLRAVSTSSGKILKTVYVSKTILSQAVDASLFKYVKFKRLLEVETGFTKNEPLQMAVAEAIEKSVESLIIEGISDKLWYPQASDAEVQALVDEYELEEEEAISTKLFERFLTERRGKSALFGSVGFTSMNGDFGSPELEFSTRLGYKHAINPYLNLNFSYNRFNLANEGVFNDGFMSFDLNAEVNILPYDKFTPYVFGGFGTIAFNDFSSIDPKLQIGMGFEYLVTNNLGITIYGEHNYAFNDELDGLKIGKNDDMFYRVGMGLNVYFTQPKTKFNEKKMIDRQKLREQRELKRINTQTLKANRRVKRLETNNQDTSIESPSNGNLDIENKDIENSINKLDQREQRRLNIKTIKENRRAAKRAAKEALRNDKTIIDTYKIDNNEN
jgi:curli production assembly/transport component CsgG